MYHGHMDFDIVFIYGALIIRDNPSYWNALGVDYHCEMGYEHHFVLSEVYHYPLHQFLLDVTGKWVGKPPIKSYTINGLSYGKWDKNNGNATGYEIIKVVPGKTYRFRVINVAADSLLRWKIEGHRLRVIEMDGILAFPVWTNHLEINSGQRYSVLVTMDKTIDNYWIQSEKIGGPGPGGPDNGRAILSYVGASDPTRMQKLVFPNVTQSIKPTSWILPQLQPNRLLAQTEVYKLDPFKKSDRKIKVDTHMVFNDKGERVFLINGHAFKKPEKALLTQVRQGIDISKTDPLIFEVIQDEIVDIIFQNRVIEQGPCIQHPIHLHGHSFYIVAEGPDVVDTSKLDDIIHKNLLNRVVQFRDTFTMFPYQIKENTTSGAGCGWTVIRFLANNPGIWLSHCHITTHMLIKKLFVIYEYSHDNPRLYNE
ncbi:unnamed protein product [Orchesella dallaii]|uniref:Uncharacterized protein n=1 Tax=Orchesella dallaii TaxID=48710 RepID=A0ABP1QT80_9HEXA